jgi:hypothetical protein
MYYIITNNRVGELGTEFEAAPGVNVEALIAGGFISEVDQPGKVSTPAPKKGAKKDTETNED